MHRVDVDAVTVSIDAAKVERILENLLSNAIRHTPDGTRSGSSPPPRTGA